MPISGLVITCEPGKAADLAKVLHRPDSVEIHGVVDGSTLVAVIDAPTVADEVAITKDLMGMEGVVDVRLAYHNFEDTAT